MLGVLPPPLKPVLQLIQVDASCVNNEFWLDEITRGSLDTQELRRLLQNFFLWPVTALNMY